MVLVAVDAVDGAYWVDAAALAFLEGFFLNFDLILFTKVYEALLLPPNLAVKLTVLSALQNLAVSWFLSRQSSP